MAVIPWGARAGAALGLAAFFIPQREVSGVAYSPFTLLPALHGLLAPSAFGTHAAWLLAPPVASMALLAGAVRGGRSIPFVRWLCVVLLLAGSFAMATQASILLTSVQPHAGAGGPSSTLALLLFAVPIGASAVVLARVLGGAAPDLTGALARAGIGLLLALNALYMIDAWWRIFALWSGAPSADRVLAGAALAPAAGLAVAVAEVLRAVRPAQETPGPASP